MNLESIFIKTAKGQDEVATRAFKLPSRVRTLLVMVDGKTSGAQIVANTAALGDSAAYFKLLAEEGFIEPVAAPAGAGMAGIPQQDVRKPSRELVQSVSHMITEILGPAGDSLTVRLEKSASLEEFARLVEQAREVIESSVGKKKGEQFMKDVLEKLPGTA